MLSGEGNAGERLKTTIGLISKKATLHVQHTFLYISLPLFCTTTMWTENSKKFLVTRFRVEKTSYVFFCVYVFFFFFSVVPLIFILVAASISYFLTATSKISCCFSNKKCLRSFLSLALALCRSFPRWASLAWCLLSPFLCLSLSLYSKFVDMKINLSLIL